LDVFKYSWDLPFFFEGYFKDYLLKMYSVLVYIDSPKGNGMELMKCVKDSVAIY